MNTNAIRDVATKARRQLMEAVERRCLLYGIEEGAQRDADTVNGRVLSASERSQRRELLRMQDELRGDGKPGSGHAALVEQAAYTWFNRLFAIRFMELNDRLPSHVRMLSAQDGSFAPECLHEAMDLPLDALDRGEVARLVAEGDDEGLFRLVLLAQCAELAECMPAVFERVGSAMELLLPDGLLAKDGVIESLVTGVPENDWREGVEIVGWAYQFYVLERHDEVFAGYKKSKKAGPGDIAPATQLFTPDWIVRYLTDNSLGRLWKLNNPTSGLITSMNYYLEPNSSDHERHLVIASPENIKVVDPACGSGHILCYAFDLLARMYEELGYRKRDIARFILSENLSGIEIDSRAASLASFALTMKACELDPRFLNRAVPPRITCIQSVEFDTEELSQCVDVAEHAELFDTLKHLGEIGSLWSPTAGDYDILNQLESVAVNEVDLFAKRIASKASTAKGYANLLSTAYDVVITNPPYMGNGNMNAFLSDWVTRHYPDEKSDLCTCFVSRGMRFAKEYGYNAIITSDTCMYLASFNEFRKNLLQNSTILTLIDTRGMNAHPDVFDANAGWVFSCGFADRSFSGTYVRLNNRIGEKEQALRDAASNPECDFVFHSSAERFEGVPGLAFDYWIGDGLLRAFAEGRPLTSIAQPRKGLGTGNKDLFLRLWWEVPFNHFCMNAKDAKEAQESRKRWFPHNKGGSFRKWYGNCEFVVDWSNDGEAIKSYRNASGQLAARPQNQAFYFRECVSWSKISSGQLAFRFKPSGDIFNEVAPAFFADRDLMFKLEAFLNSSVCHEVAKALSPTLDFQVGQVASYPILSGVIETDITVPIVDQLTRIARVDWDSFETSWDFSAHPLVRGSRISAAYGLWTAECKDRFDTLKSNEEQLNAIFAHIYHMEGEVSIEVGDDKVSVRLADLGRDVRSLLSYAVGCMFGRYSLDRPGLVLANQGDGLPEYLSQVPHPRYMPDGDGILPITDDEYFDDDIVAMLCEWLRKAYGSETLEENLQFIADALGGTGTPRRVIRDYFMGHFFSDHCAVYTTTNAGKLPIYWLIDSGKLGGFRALIYMHRYTPDLLARVRTDYVHERQERYRSRITDLEREREGASRREQSAIDKELKRLRAQLDEVTKFEERLHHLADQMIEIDLDDGFKVNYAKFADVMAKVK